MRMYKMKQRIKDTKARSWQWELHQSSTIAFQDGQKRLKGVYVTHLCVVMIQNEPYHVHTNLHQQEETRNLQRIQIILGLSNSLLVSI